MRKGGRDPGKGLSTQAVCNRAGKFQGPRAPETQGDPKGTTAHTQGRWTRGGVEIWSRHAPHCSPPGQMPGDSASTAPSGLPLSQPPTFLHHAHSQALLEAAELAAVSPPLVHRAVLVSQADVLGVFLHCALEGGQHGTGCQGVGRGKPRGGDRPDPAAITDKSALCSQLFF